MKTDIVERLNLRDASCSYVENIYKDAAAEILRLRADNEKLRANFTVLADAVRAAKEAASYNRHKNEHCISRILSLRADNEKLRAALKPFADVAENDIGDDETDADIFRPITGRYNHAPLLTVGDLRTAAAALKETGE